MHKFSSPCCNVEPHLLSSMCGKERCNDREGHDTEKRGEKRERKGKEQRVSVILSDDFCRFASPSSDRKHSSDICLSFETSLRL
jgi:hypothetical protein